MGKPKMDETDREVMALLARVLFAILHKCENDLSIKDVRRLREISEGKFGP